MKLVFSRLTIRGGQDFLEPPAAIRLTANPALADKAALTLLSVRFGRLKSA